MEPSKVIWTINALGRMTYKRSSRQWHNVSTTSPKHIHPEVLRILVLNHQRATRPAKVHWCLRNQTICIHKFRSTLTQNFSECLHFIISKPQGQLRSTEVCRIRILSSTSYQKHTHPEVFRMLVLSHPRAARPADVHWSLQNQVLLFYQRAARPAEFHWSVQN